MLCCCLVATSSCPIPTPITLASSLLDKKRKIRPPEITLDFDQQIQEELKLLQPSVEAFLNAPELPTWDPPDNFLSDIKKFIKGLQIPTYRNGKPSLLFHKLDECDDKDITKIFGADTHVYVIITALNFFFMRKYRSPDVNGVGIRDLRDALDLATNYREWVSDLHDLSLKQRAAQNNINSQIASRVFHRDLAARIVVFKFFLQVAVQVDGGLQEKHKRIWLLFHLFDFLNPHGGSFHPFLRIIDKLRGASDETLNTSISGFNSIIDEYIPRSRFILGLDEAQQATRLYPYSGVSGTGSSLADLGESMASGVSKPAQGVKVFHELGMFDSWPKLKSFVERYVPLSILQSHLGYGLQVRMQEYLLGRYRFSVSFLEYFLMNGLQSPHKLLNKYLEGHITCPAGDTGLPLYFG
ncbi:hypothetical protein AX15_007143 [Amanita polypyramis BW_CC]|nr:hypothetical protein AX15_007143 [Amanita polypyramis BW_CC]